MTTTNTSSRVIRLLTQAIFGGQLPEETEHDAALAASLHECVNSLGDYLAAILILRFGLPWPVPEQDRLRPVAHDPVDHVRSRTLAEVGKHFGLTRERVRQMEAKALRQLRHPSRSRHLSELIGLASQSRA